MARPRYSAAKRQREVRKKMERERKLARKHARRAGQAAGDVPAEEGVIAPETEGAEPAAGTEPASEPD